MKNRSFAAEVLVLIFSVTACWPLAGYSKNNTDSLVPATPGDRQKTFPKLSRDSGIIAITGYYTDELFTSELSAIEADYIKTGNNKKTILHLLRALKTKRKFIDIRNKRRFFSDLAAVSARLKLYAFAMQCFYKYAQPDSDLHFNFPIDTTNMNTNSERHADPEPVTGSDILNSFSDHKSAFAYALILHVKQPLTGKRKAFTGINNVGHMFITLIKYNDDSSVVSRSFGFYPEKNSNIAATPLHPSSQSTFKDDRLHNWDEAIGKFISIKRFEKILRLLDKYDQKTYNLNQNNCTDFALNVAGVTSIQIFDTNGKWPFGKGSNPANAGQSILERKFINADSQNTDDLFVCDNTHPVK